MIVKSDAVVVAMTTGGCQPQQHACRAGSDARQRESGHGKLEAVQGVGVASRTDHRLGSFRHSLQGMLLVLRR